LQTPEPGVPLSKARKPWVVPTAFGLGGFILGMVVLGGGLAISGALQSAGDASILADAVDTCTLSNDANAELSDEGQTLTVNQKGDEDVDGLLWTNVECLLDAMETPTAVRSHMEQTTSVDGRQTEEWDRVSVSWSYHPDRGMDSVFTVQR